LTCFLKTLRLLKKLNSIDVIVNLLFTINEILFPVILILLGKASSEFLGKKVGTNISEVINKRLGRVNDRGIPEVTESN
jgi:uncharacterized protein YwlG (UPF0340 family)